MVLDGRRDGRRIGAREAATRCRRGGPPSADAAALTSAITSRLNPEQARAVTTTRGPLLILAGAGSGKTRVLAHRIAYLVGVEGVPPWQILAVTFTNKAAAEMRERILALVGDEGRQVAMGTFHALCARVLRRDGAAIGIDPRFTIYDTDDQTGIVKQVLRDLELRGGTELRPAAVLSAISRWKNDLVSPLEADEAARGFLEAQMARAYTRYAKRLREASALDFDDLLIEAVRLFEQAPAVLAHYRQRWRYLHVDEYQDTNRAQYLWVKLLAAEHRNVAVVGDDDQSIYSWRGADLRNILDFEQDYPEATVVKLEQNYRSTQLILDAAHAVVERNEGRKDKKLWTQNPRGALIERFEADREDEEAEWVARQVEALVAGRGSAGSVLARRADDGDDDVYRLQDVAVMYRTNAQSRAIEEAFLRYGLRYQLVGGTRFYQRREVKDALAYLRLLRNDHDVAAFERVVNVPPRGLGQRSLEALRELTADRGGDVWAALGAAAEGAGELTPRAREAFGALPRAHRAPAAPRRPRLAAGAAGHDARGVGLPGHAHGRLPGRRGPLGQPARAARGRRSLRRPRARPMPSTGSSRRRPWWPTRTPTPATPTRSRSSRCTPPRASSSRSSSSAAWRRASSRTPARSTIRARWRRSAASPTWA